MVFTIRPNHQIKWLFRSWRLCFRQLLQWLFAWRVHVFFFRTFGSLLFAFTFSGWWLNTTLRNTMHLDQIGRSIKSFAKSSICFICSVGLHRLHMRLHWVFNLLAWKRTSLFFRVHHIALVLIKDGWRLVKIASIPEGLSSVALDIVRPVWMGLLVEITVFLVLKIIPIRKHQILTQIDIIISVIILFIALKVSIPCVLVFLFRALFVLA